jgi:hypothetical protein
MGRLNPDDPQILIAETGIPPVIREDRGVRACVFDVCLEIMALVC